MNLGLFKNVIYKMCLEIIYKKDLVLNDQQWLICHKTNPSPVGLTKVKDLVCPTIYL